MSFKKTCEIEFNHLGTSNVISNTGFLEIFEDVGGAHSDSIGCGLKDLKTNNMGWILLNWKLQVFSRPTYGTKVNVETWPSSYSKCTTIRNFEMTDNNGTVIAIASSKWALLDASTFRPMRITEELYNKFSPNEKEVFPNFEFSKLKEPENFSNEFDYTVLRRDIDVNHHMHNLYYLDLALEAIPEDIYNSTDFKNVDIYYKREIKDKDEIKFLYNYNEETNEHTITIKSKDDSVLHSVIKMSI